MWHRLLRDFLESPTSPLTLRGPFQPQPFSSFCDSWYKYKDSTQLVDQATTDSLPV